jgi:hypothetical protein
MDFIPLGVGAPGDLSTFLLTGLEVSPASTALSVKKLTFQKPSSTTGVQTVTGVGFQGVALLLWTDRQTGAGVTDGAQMCVGMTDGTTQVTRSIIHPDNEASTTSGQSERTDCVVYLTNATSGATPTLQARAEFGAFTSDGFTLDWTTNDADATLFHALVLSGVQANLVSPKLDVAPGATLAVTSVGFQPDAFITLGGTADEFGTGDYSFGAPFGSICGFGFSNGTDQMCGWTLGRGTAGASDTERGQHTDRAVSVRTANLTGASELTAFSITAIGADGFTMTRRTGGQDATRPVQHVLCLRGARFSMGSFTTPAAPGDRTFSVSGTPTAVLLQTHGVNTAEADGMSLAVGAWDAGGTEGGIWIGGTDNANPSVYARATYTDSTLKSYTPAATGSSSTLEVDGSVSAATSSLVTVSFSTVPAFPAEVLYLSIAQGSSTVEPPEGGGEVPESVNPDAGDDPGDFPIVFVQIRLKSGTSYYFAEKQLNDNATWTEAPGKKPGKLERISPVRRELSTRGAYVATRSSFTLADTDRQFRALVASNALRGAYVAYYVISDAQRRAEGTPRRFFGGEIVSHRAEPGPRYTFEVEDVMGRRLSEYAKQPQLPPDKFNATDFPAIDILQTGADGMPIPIVCGYVSDADVTSPQGVAPATFVGDLYFSSAWGGTATQVDAYVWSQGAFPANGVFEVYYNDPTTPNIRQLVPESAWGVAAWTPGKPGWAATGLSTDYADYNGRRYMPLFVLRSHPLAQAAREGNVLIAGNLYGIAENANGTGRYIDSPVRLWQWLLVNYVFNRYEDESSYFTIPTLDGTYSIIDTATVDAAKEVHDARLSGGYLAGFILGGLGNPETVFDVMQWLAEGCDFDWGINRHGQLIVSAEDTAASAVATFDQQADIEDGQYEVWTDTDSYFNRLEYTYGYRYVPPVAPPATPAEGEPVPTKLPPHSDWRSGLVITEDTGAQTTVGEIVTYTLNNYAVQHSETAQDVAGRVLARALGPQDDGPRMFRFTTGWNGLHQDGEDIELGSVINVLHPERVGASASGTDKCRVLAIEVDPLRDRVTLEGRIIG